MTAAATTSVLGLTAAVIWGAADFSGGIAARYLRVYWLLVISHACSLAALVLLAGLLHDPLPNAHILGWGLISGFAGGSALLMFYYALSLGDMGITAAITGLLTAALPVLFTLATIGAPSRRQLVGFLLAAGAIWLISSQPGIVGEAGEEAIQERRKKLALAILSGVGFGVYLIALRQANGGGLLWPLAASRVSSLTLAVAGGLIFSRRSFTVEAEATTSSPAFEASKTGRWDSNARRAKIGIALAILAGACDTSGNFFFVAATRTGRLDVAAVLASLYPASTILLAIWLLKERTTARQAVGMATALVAVALIS